MLEERKEGKKILHGRKGKERQLPELLDMHVVGLCEDTCTSSSVATGMVILHAFSDTPTACGGTP